jgi:uncharacterized membrane protein
MSSQAILESSTRTGEERNRKLRIQSVDILRGAVMVLMAIDHVRVYSGVAPGGPDPGVFFTRWITHFCAPAFAFFAGTSAFLYFMKVKDHGKLAQYLITRGLLLVFLEMTVIRFFWAFNVSTDFILAGVIWMLGWCMVMLAALIKLQPRVVGLVGVGIILIQQAFAFVPSLLPESASASFGKFWEFIYPSGFETYAGVSVLYSLIPWIGVMAAGYGFGTVLMMDEKRRNKLCLTIGLTATALFIVVGSAMALSDPGDDAAPFIFRLLNQSKYPASQLFLCMTLGPIIALIPFAERARGWFANVLNVFGRVAFFYYLLHIIVIHVTALGVNMILYGDAHQEWYTTAPFVWLQDEFKWSLPLLYLVFLADVVVLYLVCKWYASYKQTHPEQRWLVYL